MLKLNIKNTNETVRKLQLLPKLSWRNENKEEYQRKLNENIEHFTTAENILMELCEVIKKSTSSFTAKNRFEPKNKWYNNK